MTSGASTPIIEVNYQGQLNTHPIGNYTTVNTFYRDTGRNWRVERKTLTGKIVSAFFEFYFNKYVKYFFERALKLS